ncbi:NADH--cytochrome b5 reductase 1-like [Jatropha curcas]|uniref:NADH--cytochrome b5 reductase 1-like n=1 Tax=Jatropha curcas TaxID=180498 RepID=UPI001894443A|nr:NADH--cytochrome b5 reductase 1-like [Jatropha curcas]
MEKAKSYRNDKEMAFLSFHSLCHVIFDSQKYEMSVQGRFEYRPGRVGEFGMIAGGSGITPIFQITRAILENPADKTNLHLIYANTTYEDILLKDELDGFASKFPSRFKVFYVLSQPPEAWDGGVGHITKEMIQIHCPPPASHVQILRCGPPGMNKAVAAHLNAIGYTPNMQFEC